MNKFFRVPSDILCDMKNEFPEIKNIELVIDKLFELIFKKTIVDGACSITRFGNFFAFKVFSKRVGKIVPRFKFAMSRAMRHILAADQYMMEQIPEIRQVSPRVAVVEKNGDKTGGEIRRIAEKNRSVARRKTIERVARDEIASILEESDD